MICLPIVERELRVRARLRSTYRLRLAAANLAFLAVLAVLFMGNGRGSSRFGALVFRGLAWGAFALCLTEGARNTADSLSAEKREGTLGLLFLTDLRPYDVVLGKMMATSLNSCYGLMAIFPPMAVPLLVGGVTFEEFWRLVFVLLNTLFFSVSLGMAVSSAFRDDRQAWSTAMVLAVAWAAIPALLWLHPTGSMSWPAALSPATGLMAAFDAAYSAAPDRYWRSLGWVHALGWGLLAATAIILPRAWQDRPEPPTTRSWLRFLPARFSPPPPWMDRLRRSVILDGNPAVWLVVRAQRKMTLLWVIVAGASVCAVTVWILTDGAGLMSLSILLMILLLHLAVAMWVGTEACHLFAGARDSGSLELLLSTPLSARMIVEGHLEGLRQRFLPPVATLVTVELVLLAAQLYLEGVNGRSVFLCLGLLAVVGLVLAGSLLDMVAVARYGLWQGLANRKASRAVTKTLLHVLILPFGLSLLLGFGALLPVVGWIKNLVFINYARDRLRREFRSLLTERYGWEQESEFVAPAPPRRPIDPLPSVWMGTRK